jgi:hypothetical protein
MNCEEFETTVNDLAREEMMDVSVRARALAHRDECLACARRLEDESALSSRLRELANQTSELAAPAMGNDLLTAFRSRQPGVSKAPAVASWRARPMIAGAMAVAAMILIAIAVTFVRSRATITSAVDQPKPESPQSVSPSKQVVGALDPPVAPAAPLPKTNSEFAGRKNKLRRLNRRVSPAETIAKDSLTTNGDAASVAIESEPEITSDFMPVGYASAASLEDGGQLVRVELPRSALVAFGLPMNINRYDEKVKADVFFGSDGMARAIRFVQ